VGFGMQSRRSTGSTSRRTSRVRATRATASPIAWSAGRTGFQEEGDAVRRVLRSFQPASPDTQRLPLNCRSGIRPTSAGDRTLLRNQGLNRMVDVSAPPRERGRPQRVLLAPDEVVIRAHERGEASCPAILRMWIQRSLLSPFCPQP
jgi:hypothetical protein